MNSDSPTEPPKAPPSDAAPETRTQLPTMPAGPATSPPVAIPAELVEHSRYRVVKLLGSGGMGAVFQAEHRVMERSVALKVMRADLIGSPEAVERFRREVKAAAQLHHPNIVTAFDAEQAGSAHFLVMEYVAGTDLATYVAEKGPLPIAEACDYVRQAALGLQHAHERGINHRDIKPSNLMRTADATIKVMDFGLARFAGPAGEGQTVSGVILGTVDFMAPEQADNARTADIRSDIYSLGCTLFYLLTRRPLFPDGTMIQRVMAHVDKPPPSLAEFRDDVPPRLLAVMAKMLAKHPRDRYQAPAEVVAELGEVLGGPAASPITVIPPPLLRNRPDIEPVDDEFDSYPRPREYPPHRGVLILVLGITSIVIGLVGLLVCAPIAFVTLAISIPAWVMGSKDLRKIKAREMDPDGYGMTLGGYICGIIGTVAGILAGLCAIISLLFFGATMAGPLWRR